MRWKCGSGNPLTAYVNQIIMLHASTLYSDVHQLHLNKTRENSPAQEKMDL